MFVVFPVVTVDQASLLVVVVVLSFVLVVLVGFMFIVGLVVVVDQSSLLIVDVVVSLVLLFVVLHLFSMFVVVVNHFIISCFCASFFLLFMLIIFLEVVEFLGSNLGSLDSLDPGSASPFLGIFEFLLKYWQNIHNRTIMA